MKWGIPGIVCFSGNRIPGMSDEDAIAHTAAVLRRLAPRAEEHGVTLNMELLNSKVDHPGYQCDRTAWGMAVVEKVNEMFRTNKLHYSDVIQFYSHLVSSIGWIAQKVGPILLLPQ